LCITQTLKVSNRSMVCQSKNTSSFPGRTLLVE
jgi:hypothetical protein